MSSHLKTLMIWVVAFAVVLIGYQIFSAAGSPRQDLDQSEFYALVDAGEIGEVTVTGDMVGYELSGAYKSPRTTPSGQTLDKVDHIINVFRVSTHVWSHYTLAIKNWVGIMRPDDRVWMHQLNYLKNRRHIENGLNEDDPIRNEPLYHEQLADLHLPHIEKERLCVADASQIILTGGPDDTDRPFCQANLVLAARDIITADVVGLAVLRYEMLMASDGLHGRHEPQPAGWLDAFSGVIKDLKWPEGKHVFRGTDAVSPCRFNLYGRGGGGVTTIDGSHLDRQ